HLTSVVEFAFGVIDLIQTGVVRLCDIDDCNAVFALRDVGISSGHVNIAGAGQWKIYSVETNLPGRTHIDGPQSVIVNHKSIAKLNRNRARVFEGDTIDNRRIQRIVETDDHQ